jgi:quinone-modifying oxidoreductase subunit QmoC
VTFARSTNHLLVMFGFIFLAAVTALAFYHEWFDPHGQVTKVYVTMKLLAIPGTAALLYGIYNVIKERQANADKAGYGSYFDWFLIYVIAAVGVTGLGSWVFRMMHISILAYPTYFLHLTAVFMLFFYAPFSKMAHMVYRTVAMLYARMAERGF